MDSSAKRILLVDDDDIFRGALTQTLTREGFEVTSVPHARNAQDLIGVQSFEAVISDINMPGISGVDLLRHCQQTNPDLPVILMTGFSDLKETAEAHELGAKGFLPKPFKKEELIQVLQASWKSQGPAPEEEDQDLNFCKLSIDDFVSGREIKFDIYIRLSEKKYIKIGHQGEDIPVERIASYKEKKIRYLYMQKDDFRRYMGFNVNLLPLVNAAAGISKEKKRAFLKHTSDVILEHLYLNGVDEEGFQGARTVVESTASLFTDQGDMMNLLTLLNSHSDHLYAHSLGVSLYGVMIARELKWKSPVTIYNISMGGLLHDIGKKEIPREVLDKRRQDLSSDEIKLYESHSHRGVEILSGLPSVSSDVLQIVLQHHENCLGLGFPTRLSKSRIHPLARLIAVADEFCSLTLKTPHNIPLPPADAVQRMILLHSGKFDPMFFVSLMRVFKITPPRELDR